MTALDRLREAIERIEELSSPCLLCPRECKAKRKEGELGVCGLDDKLKVFCCNLHFGEEPPLSGTGLTEGVKAKGSGTVFFSGCNLRCVFCQNFAFSHNGNGKFMTVEDLSEEMLKLQKRGAKNINFVTPTPQILPALKALYLAREKGMAVVLVAHRLATIRNCDRILFMEAGRIVATGTYDELLQECPAFRAMARAEE